MARRLSSGLPPSIQSCRGRRSNWLLWGNPPSPSEKVTSWLSTSGSLFPTGFPQGVDVGVWGCIQLSESDLHELSQFIIHKIPKAHLQLLWGPTTQMRVARGEMGFLLPVRGKILGATRFPIYYCHISPCVGSRRWGSPNYNGFIMQHQCFHDPTCHDL